MEELNKKANCAKKIKDTKSSFFNTLLLSILYRNKNRKGLKRFFFFDSCGLLTTHSEYKPIGLYSRGLKSGINSELGSKWPYIWVGLYLDGPLFGT